MRRVGLVLTFAAGLVPLAGGGCRPSNVVPSSPPANIRSPQPTGPIFPETRVIPGIPQSYSGLPLEWRPVSGTREWTSIVIHHTASRRGSVESIHEAHLQRKDGAGNAWQGIGYHFVIGNGDGMGDGEVEPTFRWREQMHGAHAGDNEYNQHGIGIVLVGNFEDAPPSAAQLAAVKRLVGALRSEYRISADKVVGHRDVKATECPGKHFPMAEVSRSGGDTTFGRVNTSGAPLPVARIE